MCFFFLHFLRMSCLITKHFIFLNDNPCELILIVIRFVLLRVDPWASFDLNNLPAEKATRHRYNAISKTWTLDEVIVKMDTKPFDKGAMRECFRM